MFKILYFDYLSFLVTPENYKIIYSKSILLVKNLLCEYCTQACNLCIF